MVTTKTKSTKTKKYYSRGYIRGLTAGFNAKRSSGISPLRRYYTEYMERHGFQQFSCPVDKKLLKQFKATCKRDGHLIREALDQALILWLNI